MKKEDQPTRRRFLKQVATSSLGVIIPLKGFTKETEIGFKEFNKELRVQDVQELPEISHKVGRTFLKWRWELSPSVDKWELVSEGNSPKKGLTYKGSDYLLTLKEKELEKQISIWTYTLQRTDGRPFEIIKCSLEGKTSYSGVYKIFTPGLMAQQNYKIDLPFRINDSANVIRNQPVVWMQETNGQNTLIFGYLDQIPLTIIEGSTYDTGNGGEAPGIANSYIRIAMDKVLHEKVKGESFKDGIYINANTKNSWFEALSHYGLIVDEYRDFNYKDKPISKWAMNPMWHSWYAHGDRIDENKIRKDAEYAAKLGLTTIEIDAGWNLAPGTHYSFEVEGDYRFNKERFPEPKGMIRSLHKAGQRVILHVSPLIMGKDTMAWEEMEDCLIKVNGKRDVHMDPRLKKVHDYLLASWEYLFSEYDVDGLWYDFLEIPGNSDPADSQRDIISEDIFRAYNELMLKLYEKALSLKSDAVIIMRRDFANLNSKLFCTHVWPMDTPQDYNMNRRDIVYMKTFGKGVLTHACCTSWAIGESTVNVAKQMASIVMAGVPALSVLLREAPEGQNEVIQNWLSFYNQYKEALLLGEMIPLLPTPPSAAIQINKDSCSFIGFFEAVPGLVTVPAQVTDLFLINAFSSRTVTRIEGVDGMWSQEVYDGLWNLFGRTKELETDDSGLNLNVHGSMDCTIIKLKKWD